MARSITVIPAERRSPGGRGRTAAKKIRMAAYCRVSTEQDEQLNSLENQVNYYRDYIRRNPEYELVDIYADEGISGTGTKKREQFNRMIADCEAGKIDRVITKSISRFARNTQDCLNYSRKLKRMGIGILFEKENINTMDDTGELLFTILSSLAQEESRNISENSKWGIRHQFQQGIVHVNAKGFMGYDHGKNGELVINPKQAKIVQRVFREFEEGWTLGEIARHLNADKIKGIRGKVAWNNETIRGMLANEKYVGDALLQKTYTMDYLTRKRIKNTGQVTQYYVKDNHPAIIPREEWEAVQLELARRDALCKELGIKGYGCAPTGSPLISRVVCGTCGTAYRRKYWENRDVKVWNCKNREGRAGATCRADNVKDKVIQEQAIILVAGYPQLLDKNGKGAAISKEEATQINSAVKIFNNRLESMITEQCGDIGNIYFVDVIDAFNAGSGHQAYSKEAWINPIMPGTESEDLKDFPQIVVSAYSIHPNSDGAQAYADCVNKVIEEIESGGTIKDSWEQIIASCNDGTYKTKYHIGDKKALNLGSEGVVEMQIAAFDADELADGSGAASITWISKQALKSSHRMNPNVEKDPLDPTNTYYLFGTGSIGGWANSEMRSWMNSDLKALIPSVVRNSIKSVRKYSSSYGKKTIGNSDYIHNEETVDDLWIPSYREIGGLYNHETLGPVYSDLFKPGESDMNKDWIRGKNGESIGCIWWLRTACDTTCQGFRFIDPYHGYIGDRGKAGSEYGVVLGFCM